MKVKLDKQTIQGFFVRHVEKLVVALLVFVFGWMAYAAATRQIYSHEPKELVRMADGAERHVGQTVPKAGEPKVPAYKETADRSRTPVSEKDYNWPQPVDKPIWPESTLRSEPPLFLAEKLSVHAGTGAFLLKTGSTGQQNVGQRWIVLTALVPAEKQVQAYRDTFKDYKRPETDTPNYLHYWVERAELVGDQRDANPDWVRINVKEARQKALSSWAATSQGLVAAPYIHEPLVFPLGPLMNASWDERVAHPPEIPVFSSTSPASPEPKVPSGAKPPRPDIPVDAPMLAPKGKPAEDVPMGVGGAAPKPGLAGPLPVAGVPGGAMEGAVPRAPGQEGQAADEGHTADVTGVPYLLLRFFDFSVEPGKSYLYRVKLLLANPNYNYEVRYLAKPELAKDPWIETEWSEPSTPVFVPRDDRLLVKSVKAPARINLEPLAFVTLVKWLVEHGSEASEDFKITRGQLANLTSGTSLVPETEEQPEAAAGLLSGEEEKPSKKKDKGQAGSKIQFKSDNLLLDLRGGEKLRGQAAEPGELLLLDYDGSLTVRTELDDLASLPKPAERPAESVGAETTTDKKGAKKSGETAGPSIFAEGDEKKPKREKTGKKK